MSCTCPVPRERSYDRSCRTCGKLIDPRCVSNDENMARFVHLLAGLPDIHREAIVQALERERAGRRTFGLSYLARDNPAEAQEEAADGINYCAFQWFCDRRDGAEAIDLDLLDAAHHFARAHAALERRRRREG